MLDLHDMFLLIIEILLFLIELCMLVLIDALRNPNALLLDFLSRLMILQLASLHIVSNRLLCVNALMCELQPVLLLFLL